MIVSSIGEFEILECLCDNCKQPMVVYSDIVVKIYTDDYRKFLLAKEVPCGHCGRKTVLPKTFDSSKEAIAGMIETYLTITHTSSLSEIKMLSVIETRDIEKIFS